PDIHAQLARPAEPAEFLRLENLEQLGLELRRQLADLIEEDRAVIGQLEQADLPFLGVGIRTLFVSEQFGIEERRREAGAVDLDERTTGAGREIVDHARGPALPRPALA